LSSPKEKAKRLGSPLIFLDESGFSLSPIRGTTWCEIGNTGSETVKISVSFWNRKDVQSRNR
jgi:hypothetical protein